MSSTFTRIYLENRTADTLYISLKVKDGRLEMHLYDDPASGAPAINARHITSYVINDRMQACITGGKLNFTVIGHNKLIPKIGFTPGLFKKADGPIFTFFIPGDPLV